MAGYNVGGIMGRSMTWRDTGTLLGAAIILIYALHLLFSVGYWTKTIRLEPAMMRAEAGQAYLILPLPLRANFPLLIIADQVGAGSQSGLVLRESGTFLEPGHAPHTDIRTTGKGAYSHWEQALFFSSSDGTDPRQNGRIYEATAPYTLHPAILAFNLGLTALFVLFWGRDCLEWCVRQQSKVILSSTGAIVGFAGLLFFLVAQGRIPPINGSAGAAKDWGLMQLIAGHSVLGFVLFTLVALTSTAMGALMLRRNHGRASEWLFLGYPIALPLTTLLAACFIAVPWGGVIAPVLLVLSWVPLLIWRPDGQDMRALMKVLAGCIIPICFYAFYMVLLWHGPTETLGNNTQGDIAHSAGVIHTLRTSLYPLWNLAAEGDILPYGNTPPMLYGAAFLGVPGFDAMLFLTCSNGIFFGCWLASGLYGATQAARERGMPLASMGMVTLVIILVVVATRRPSFAVDSPAVPLALPLVFSAFAFLPRVVGNVALSAAASVGIGIGTAFSKMSLFISWPLLVGFEIVRSIFRYRLTMGQWVFLALAALVGGGFAIHSLLSWGLVYWKLYVPGPDVRILIVEEGVTNSITVLFSILREIGWLLIGWVLLRSGPSFLTAAYWSGLIACLLYPYLFDSNAMMNLLAVALAVILYPREMQRFQLPLLIGASLVLPFIFTRDYGGSQTAFIWVPVVVTVCLFSLSLEGRFLPFLKRASLALMLTIMALMVVGTAQGWLRINPQFMSGDRDYLTPGMYDMWAKLRRDVEKDALIFTDLSGPEARIGDGWNAFAAVAERQFYISSWLTSFNHLRINKEARAQVLATNEQVLNGQIPPGAAPVKRLYSAYYAVIRKERPVPVSFTHLYSNRELSLYRINR